MLQGYVPFPGVRHIDFFQEGVAFAVYANDVQASPYTHNKSKADLVREQRGLVLSRKRAKDPIRRTLR